MLKRKYRTGLLALLLCFHGAMDAAPKVPFGNDHLLRCFVEGSDDQFLFYPSMLIRQSGRFSIYALMGGLTLAVVDHNSGRFNRLTSLNLADPEERIQFFSGQCRAETAPE